MDPQSEYTRRLEARRAEAALRERQHRIFGNARLGTAIVAAVMVWMVFASHILAPQWLIAPVAVFMALAARHGRVLQSRGRAARAARLYERGLARIEDRWAGAGERGDRFADPAHPYSADLDIFGEASLFQLLSSARTRAGEETLARWLTAAASPEEIRARHEAIEDLRERLDLREDLSLLGEEVRAGVHPEALARWGEMPPLLTSQVARAFALGLALLMAVALAILFSAGNRTMFLAQLILVGGFGWKFRGEVLRAADAVDSIGRDLELLAGVLGRIERESFRSPRLAVLAGRMRSGGEPPAQRIIRLSRWIAVLDSRHAPLIGPLLEIVLWTTQCAFAIEAWRRVSGGAVRGWLEAAGEFEALSSLAAYAYEHPADRFPEIRGEGPVFDGEALAHPLLSAAKAVPNDVRLDRDQRLLVVSGSNMSGKSTLLRTVGIQVVLAMAGAPVRARRLRISPMTLGASIRNVDSLQGGSSRFYAEITRLRVVMDLARGEAPVLFLLDELLSGTNSHDRRIGAAGVVRGLLERGAVGLVTTHDLALTHLVESVSPPGVNVHFEDHLEDGRMSFDYRLRPGVVQKSNALELMRSVGLDV
jgi:hypothetical protein